MLEIIRTFENPYPNQEYTVEFELPEQVSQCPQSNHKERVTLSVSYSPHEFCIEVDSLNQYWKDFLAKGNYYEQTINQIFSELKGNLHPKWIEVRGHYINDNGIVSKVIVSS